MARPKKSAALDLSQSIELTAGAIERLTCPPDKQQVFLRDSKAPGLRVRVTGAGAKSYVFERKLNRQTIRRTIGDVRAWSIEQARTEARNLAVLLDTGQDPREIERQQQADREAAKAIATQAAQFTLAHLLEDYIEHQQALGRTSSKDARSIFALHVISPWPKVARLPANQVTGEQVADMMRRVTELGHARTANKLRSYVKAAFAVAKAAKSKASIPVRFKGYGISSNPADDTTADESANRADKNPLTLEELRSYWHSIESLDSIRGAVLRLHLLTGGQRIEQLVKLQTKDIGPDSITLFDGKGRPGKPPRPNSVPLTPKAAAALALLNPSGQFALSTDGGITHIAATTLSEWAKQSPHGIENFTAKRIRSGVETALAAARVSSDVRGRLQSHGIAGVQARHYDGHDYLPDKREALNTLMRLLDEPESAKVVQFRAASAVHA